MAAFTAGASKPIDPTGDLYQQRAFRALPLLVRQALAGHAVYYSSIARELDMDNPRNMNYVLGSIGASLRQLSRDWNESIPPIQALVINKADELPGEGFAEFAPDPEAFRRAPLRIKRQIVDGLLSTAYSYQRWPDVLAHFGMVPIPPPDLVEMLPANVRAALGSTGESDAHRRFKELVAAHPEIVGLAPAATSAHVEHAFPSSDTVDVLFVSRGERVAVEVKSRISPDFDILRGIFQCVKYQALLNAVVAVEQARVDTRTVLVLEASMPGSLRPVANALGVSVVEMPDVSTMQPNER